MEEPQIQKLEKKQKGKFREYTEALAMALLAAFLIRSFVIEPFKIPSGSMIPTLVVGDHIFVNKFIYGLRIPFTKKRLVTFRNPKRGDAIVFLYPIDERKDFIKRVVGLPGDRVLVSGDDLFLNGKALSEREIRIAPNPAGSSGLLSVVRDAAAAEVGVESIPWFPGWEEFRYFVEEAGETQHLIQQDRFPDEVSEEFVVPGGHIFVMGDNRDNSSDSREWGFVPLENVKGKALFVWLSIDFERRSLRWRRFGHWIH